jgi:hypothetical protein
LNIENRLIEVVSPLPPVVGYSDLFAVVDPLVDQRHFIARRWDVSDSGVHLAFDETSRGDQASGTTV